MKRKLLTTLALLSVLSPAFASAQVNINVSASGATEAQILTACSQTSIEIRDSAIGSARTAYNNAMTVALDARKEAEKKAVALADAGDKKDAILVAVEAYKKAVTQAQDNLTKARKDAWAAFETNTKGCRDTTNENRETFVTEKKDAASAKQTELRTLQTEQKTVAEEHKAEAKTFREVIKAQIDTLRSFFKAN